MVTVELAFATLSLIIIVGYLGLIFFKKTKVSEIIILLLIGLLLGPIATELGVNIIGPAEMSIFESFLPFFAGFALIMILFEGGLHLNFFKAVKSLTNVFSFTIIVFILTLIFSVAVMTLLSAAGLFPSNPLLALFIAAVVGGTSSAVIIPLVQGTSAKEETKTLLSLESALTDSLCVITAVAIGEIFLLGAIDVTQIAGGILANFSIAAVMGFIFGLMWLTVLTRLEGKQYQYLMTLAIVLLIFSLVQSVGGNGAIAVLVFGIVLGNGKDITEMLQLKKRTINSSILSFQSEISFLIKTFFFVYLGLLFKLSYLTPQVIIISLAIMILVLLSRFFASTGLKKFKPIFTKDQKLITMMSARGLAAAVLVSLPASMGLTNLPNTPFTPAIVNQIAAIAFLVILFSNILTTIGIFISESGNIPINEIKEKEKFLVKMQLNKNKKK